MCSQCLQENKGRVPTGIEQCLAQTSNSDYLTPFSKCIYRKKVCYINYTVFQNEFCIVLSFIFECD